MPPAEPEPESLRVQFARLEGVITTVVTHHAARLDALEAAGRGGAGRVLSAISQLAGVASTVLAVAVLVNWK